MTDREKIRTAVIGAGKMGAIHAKVYSQLPQSELVAVVDVDQAKATQLAQTYGCRAFADWAEILDKVDAVTIATPTTTHLQIARPLLRHRIPVLIELEPERIIDTLGTEVSSPEEIWKTLVDRGLRAQLQTGSLLTGQLFVSLDMRPDTPVRLVNAGGPYPELPTIPASSATRRGRS